MYIVCGNICTNLKDKDKHKKLPVTFAPVLFLILNTLVLQILNTVLYIKWGRFNNWQQEQERWTKAWIFSVWLENFRKEKLTQQKKGHCLAVIALLTNSWIRPVFVHVHVHASRMLKLPFLPAVRYVVRAVVVILCHPHSFLVSLSFMLRAFQAIDWSRFCFFGECLSLFQAQAFSVSTLEAPLFPIAPDRDLWWQSSLFSALLLVWKQKIPTERRGVEYHDLYNDFLVCTKCEYSKKWNTTNMLNHHNDVIHSFSISLSCLSVSLIFPCSLALSPLFLQSVSVRLLPVSSFLFFFSLSLSPVCPPFVSSLSLSLSLSSCAVFPHTSHRFVREAGCRSQIFLRESNVWPLAPNSKCLKHSLSLQKNFCLTEKQSYPRNFCWVVSKSRTTPGKLQNLQKRTIRKTAQLKRTSYKKTDSN